MPDAGGETISGRLSPDGSSYQHKFLMDVRGKAETYRNVDFSYSVFERAYFHDANFIDCKFIGCRFNNCIFRNATFEGCDFKYSFFDKTIISKEQIGRNLPDWPNVRRELLQILRANAGALGDYDSEKYFIRLELEAHRDHLRRAWQKQDSYYSKKYSGWENTTKIGLLRFLFGLESLIWGHGERITKFAVCIAVVLMAAAAAVTIESALGHPSFVLRDLPRLYGDNIGTIIYLFLDVSPEPEFVQANPIASVLIVGLRYVAFGLFLSVLYRRLAHR